MFLFINDLRLSGILNICKDLSPSNKQLFLKNNNKLIDINKTC